MVDVQTSRGRPVSSQPVETETEIRRKLERTVALTRRICLFEARGMNDEALALRKELDATVRKYGTYLRQHPDYSRSLHDIRADVRTRELPVLRELENTIGITTSIVQCRMDGRTEEAKGWEAKLNQILTKHSGYLKAHPDIAANFHSRRQEIRDNASLDKLREVRNDMVQRGEGSRWAEYLGLAADITGIVDPTPVSDIVSGGLSAAKGDWAGLGWSLVACVPYVGDAVAKPLKIAARLERLFPALGKLVREAPHILNGFKELIGAGFEKLIEVVKALGCMAENSSRYGGLLRVLRQDPARIFRMMKEYSVEQFRKGDNVLNDISRRLFPQPQPAYAHAATGHPRANPQTSNRSGGGGGTGHGNGPGGGVTKTLTRADLSRRQLDFIDDIFDRTKINSFKWHDVENFLRGIGDFHSGDGSAIRVKVNGETFSAHMPHGAGGKNCPAEMIKRLRTFIVNSGLK